VSNLVGGLSSSVFDVSLPRAVQTLDKMQAVVFGFFSIDTCKKPPPQPFGVESSKLKGSIKGN
jgi:hypothetical protein